MKRVHFGSCVAALALVALVAAAAEAQQGKGRGGFGFGFGGPGGRGLVALAANEAVQKDLGLSADVTGKLNTLNDDQRAARTKEYSTAGIDLQNFQNLSNDDRQKIQSITAKLNEEFTPKLQALLSADQMKRLKQIQVQEQGAGALTNADVAAELALNDDQKKKLADVQTEFGRKQRELFAGGGGGGDFQERIAKGRELTTERDKKALELLTAEQKTKYEALKGSQFDVSQLGFGGRGRRGKN